MLLRKVQAGRAVVDLIIHCFYVRQPLLLCGVHGIGKSELLKAAATELGIEYEVRDLSIMEPLDFTGIPRVGEDGRTHYAPPAFLPTGGHGILALEEINRAPRHMWTACLQLLTERRLNDYRVPDGWLIVASMNPSGQGYDVDEFDEALGSRFVRVEVIPDLQEWTEWGRGEGDVHPSVIEFASQHPGIFDPGESNPRSLTYLSQHLKVWERNNDRDAELLLTAASGVVGETWGIAFSQFLAGGESPFAARRVLDSYGKKMRAQLKAWGDAGQLDLARASMQRVMNFLDSDGAFSEAVDDETKRANLQRFADDLPADLGRQMRDWLLERGAGRVPV